MRFDRTSTAEADRLNDLWDRHLDARDKASPTADASDAESVALIARVEALVPSLPSLEEARLRTRIDRVMTGKDASMSRTASANAHPANVKPARRATVDRTGRPPTLRTVDRFATLALVSALVSALVLATAFRDELGGGPPSQFAGFGDANDEEPTASSIGGSNLMSIEVRPGEFERGQVGVGLWTATLPGNTALVALPPFAGGTAPDIGFLVTTGSVRFTLNGDETTVAEGESVGSLPGPEYVRNTGSEPAQLLVLAPTQVNGPFPLSIGPWQPADPSAQSSAESDSATSPPAIPVSSVILDDTTAHQYRVMVSEATLAPDMPIGASRFGSPDATLRSITLREGPLTVLSPDAEDGPPPRSIQPGETVALGVDGVWASDLHVTGPDNTRVMGLLTMPAADNPTLNQNLESVAPFWGEWTVPESGDFSIAVRRLTLQRGGTYSLPTDAGAMYHVASGQVAVRDSATQYGSPVEAGGTLAQTPGTVLDVVNAGDGPATLVQALVFEGPLQDAVEREVATNGETELLVEQGATLSPGKATLMLQVHEYTGEYDGGTFGEGAPELVLITSVAGEVEVGRMGGRTTVIPAAGEEPIVPPLGEGVRIGPGGYLVAEPGSGWSVTGGTDGPSMGIVFSISPDLEPDATPLATPAPENAGTFRLVGEPTRCNIAPLTSDLIDDLDATPSAAAPLLDRSLRGADDGASDPETTEEIVALVQAYADCTATGDYTRIYAFYSDQAIRESETIQDLVEAQHNVGGGWHVTATVEELEIFPDGRAGARTVIDDQPTYLTFVMAGGQWTIDVWDDSGSGLLPGGTPAP